MNKVLQSAGRVIRTDEDEGVILLLDERFSSLRYRQMFPAEWETPELCTLETVENKTRQFWKNRDKGCGSALTRGEILREHILSEAVRYDKIRIEADKKCGQRPGGSYMSDVKRVYVEKKRDFAVAAQGLSHEVRSYLGVNSLKNVRILIRYDVKIFPRRSMRKPAGWCFQSPPCG